MPRYSPRTGLLSTYQTGPFHAAHLYLQWGGKLPGAERWSCGLRLETPGGGQAADAGTLLQNAAAVVTTFHQNANTAISQLATLDSVKLNHVAQNGKYSQPGTNESILADLPGGGPASQYFPNQVAMVVSLLTGFSRGPAHRGRFYLPLPSYNLGADGRIAASNAALISGSVDTFISSLNALSTNWRVAVFSRKSTGPTARAVTGNEIGRVYDTQRRRRRSMVEDYQ